MTEAPLLDAVVVGDLETTLRGQPDPFVLAQRGGREAGVGAADVGGEAAQVRRGRGVAARFKQQAHRDGVLDDAPGRWRGYACAPISLSSRRRAANGDGGLWAVG